MHNKARVHCHGPGRRWPPSGECSEGGVGGRERSRRQWRDLEMDWLWRMGDTVKGDAFGVWPGWTAVPSLWTEETGAQADAVHFRTPPRGELRN